MFANSRFDPKTLWDMKLPFSTEYRQHAEVRCHEVVKELSDFRRSARAKKCAHHSTGAIVRFCVLDQSAEAVGEMSLRRSPTPDFFSGLPLRSGMISGRPTLEYIKPALAIRRGS